MSPIDLYILWGTLAMKGIFLLQLDSNLAVTKVKQASHQNRGPFRASREVEFQLSQVLSKVLTYLATNNQLPWTFYKLL